MQRIYVMGISGVGKTTFAKKIAKKLLLPHTELDILLMDKYGARNDAKEFVADVTKLSESSTWVLDGNQKSVRSMLMQRADVVLVLDYSRLRVFYRLVYRQITRSIQHLTNPKKTDLLVALTIWYKFLKKILKFASSLGKRKFDKRVPANERSAFQSKTIRFRTPAQAADWLDSL